MKRFKGTGMEFYRLINTAGHFEFKKQKLGSDVIGRLSHVNNLLEPLKDKSSSSVFDNLDSPT